jgi:hypothetical protein
VGGVGWVVAGDVETKFSVPLWPKPRLQLWTWDWAKLNNYFRYFTNSQMASKCSVQQPIVLNIVLDI